jgi:hypothetical protein
VTKGRFFKRHKGRDNDRIVSNRVAQRHATRNSRNVYINSPLERTSCLNRQALGVRFPRSHINPFNNVP